jgi:predicted SprT family Zn-dependent metalloprotease
MRLQLVTLMEQEQSVFSAYSTFCGNSTKMSSLVFGDYFIHSYDFGLQGRPGGGRFLSLRTYSMHGNTYHHYVEAEYFNIVRKTLEYLRVSCAP